MVNKVGPPLGDNDNEPAMIVGWLTWLKVKGGFVETNMKLAFETDE